MSSLLDRLTNLLSPGRASVYDASRSRQNQKPRHSDTARNVPSKNYLKNEKEESMDSQEIVKAELNLEDTNQKIDQVKELIEAFKKEEKQQIADTQEKVHLENVKTYRNIQALLEDIKASMVEEKKMMDEFNSMKLKLQLSTWFSIITLLVLVAYILYELGVF